MAPYLALMQLGISYMPSFLEKALENDFNVIVAPINYIELPLDFDNHPLVENNTTFAYPASMLTTDQWNSKIICMLSNEIDCDSPDPAVRRNSEKVLLRDIAWANHIQVNGYTMIHLHSENSTYLARIVAQNIKGALLVQVPMYCGKVAQSSWRSDVDETDLENMQKMDTWDWWNSFRLQTNMHPKIKVVLECNEGERPSDEVVRRWLGEPVEALIIPSTLFVRNRLEFPVLSKEWQHTLKFFLDEHVNIIVQTSTDDCALKLYAEYLKSFMETNNDVHPLKSFEDLLEIPLQPLYDNLDCYTYEIFEKDPVKYKMYQEAIKLALIDRVPDKEKAEKTTIVMVLGAGRGPLVRAVLNASELTERKVRIYIIEKNENAIRTLKNMERKMWQNKDVHIFSQDMREFSPPEKADIIVSELLGSFGDNELSPECLDCALNILKDDGISIPCKSTSFINPIMSSRLLNAVRNVITHDQFFQGKKASYHKHAENGFVSLLKNVYHIDTPQALFEFVHPNREQPIDNTRYKILDFQVQLDCIMTGIAGYFEAVLYKNVMISSNPLTHSLGMASWFPMFFPVSEPIHLRKGDTVEIHFGRFFNQQKVWYEWSVRKPISTHIHNLGGHSYAIYSK